MQEARCFSNAEHDMPNDKQNDYARNPKKSDDQSGDWVECDVQAHQTANGVEEHEKKESHEGVDHQATDQP